MSPRFLSIKSTPQHIAEGMADAMRTKSLATGKVTIAILVHNEDGSDILLYHIPAKDQDSTDLSSLNLDHILTHEIDLQPFAADDEADVSLKAITEDAIMAKLGPVEVKNITMLRTGAEVKSATTFVFVACTVKTTELPDSLMGGLEWQPETALQNADLTELVALLGFDGIGHLLGAREHWKEGLTLDTIPDLVSSLPSTPAYMATPTCGGKVEAEEAEAEDSGYQPDSESSAGSDEAKDISDVEEIYTLKVQDTEDDLPDLVSDNDFVYGDEDLDNKAQGQQLTRYGGTVPPRRQTYTSAVDQGSDDDENDDFSSYNKKKPTKAERRVFQADTAMTRGCRVPRKQQKNPPLMVDPAYLHDGPRFARPAQKVNGHRFGTKIGRSKISLKTDQAIKGEREMWEDLERVAPEMRLV